MKKHIIIIFVIALALGLCAVLFNLWYQGKKEYKNLAAQYEQLLNNPAQPLIVRDTIRDSVKNTSSIVYVPINTPHDVGQYVPKGLADTLAMALKVAVKKLERVESKLISIDAKGKGERLVDTVTKTEWLVLKDDPVFKVRVNLANDSIFPSAKIRLSQAYAPYRKNIFSRTEYRSIVQASDHRINISDVYEVNKVPRSPRWGIGLTAGPVVTPDRLTWGVALGVNYDIIQF